MLSKEMIHRAANAGLDEAKRAFPVICGVSAVVAGLLTYNDYKRGDPRMPHDQLLEGIGLKAPSWDGRPRNVDGTLRDAVGATSLPNLDSMTAITNNGSGQKTAK